MRDWVMKWPGAIPPRYAHPSHPTLGYSEDEICTAPSNQALFESWRDYLKKWCDYDIDNNGPR